MAHTACLVCLVSNVSVRHKNPVEEQALVSGHKTKLEQSAFLRYLWSILSKSLITRKSDFH
jgi:hypothetical protein